MPYHDCTEYFGPDLDEPRAFPHDEWFPPAVQHDLINAACVAPLALFWARRLLRATSLARAPPRAGVDPVTYRPPPLALAASALCFGASGLALSASACACAFSWTFLGLRRWDGQPVQHLRARANFTAGLKLRGYAGWVLPAPAEEGRRDFKDFM